MADTLVESEILGVWQRIKRYINLSNINATDKMNQKEQLRKTMESPTQESGSFANNMQTLVDNGFPNEFVENPQIRNELLGSRIQQIKIKGQTRFQATAGTRDGKALGGTLLRGKTIEEAIQDLANKSIEKKPTRQTYKRKMGY